MKKRAIDKSKSNLKVQDINDLPSTLFVTDGKGNILISNEFTALTLGISLDELLKMNVQDLVKAGYYKRSITMEAIETKQRVSRTVDTNRGFHIKSTSIPILQKDGEVQLVVTTSNEYNGKFPMFNVDPNIVNIKNKSKEDKIDKGSEIDFVAESLAMKQIVKVCNQIASYDSKVLIYGESGTGKEVIARYLHRKSDRVLGPFVTINCAAIPPALFEQELFGYEKGAFAGASEEKQGIIEMANDGILFLDEIAEMPLEMQAKLLRVIDNNEVRRVGGVRNVQINCRIIAATNRDIWKMVKKGLFREDLYYRINVIPIHIPPLRNRKLDVVGLISFFLAEFNEKYREKLVLGADEFQKMLKSDWPGNARELRNYVERLVVTEQQNIKHSSEDMVTDWFAIDHFIKSNMDKQSTLKDFTSIVEGRYIKHVLEKFNGNATEAAKKLGIDRSVIYRKLKKMESVLQGVD
ncbi:sigma-54 interaction domain-containing protein [Bacillus sp. USDA818B3_A]|uniref:sigma-54 interaction domain-containing protein n=1 Tax=Bacillus sp. USDA818B3_A TaxID=2698834 RepID=UPI00136A2B5B|nr:sigma 54-interacting transcriptional regulator [Bacillus sp. USDA818B3_A]